MTVYLCDIRNVVWQNDDWVRYMTVYLCDIRNVVWRNDD